jgi:hypothetical protein
LIEIIIALTLASTDSRSAGECKVLDYGDWKQAPDQRWDYRWPQKGPAQISIFGAEHVRDPAHPQFKRIEAAFAELKPTLVFFEGPDRGVSGTAEETIRTRGESGYLRFLAKEAGLKAQSLEPSPAEQIKLLSAAFPIDQVMLFFVLREATRLRDRENLRGEALDAALAGLLQKLQPLTAGSSIDLPFSDLAGLQAAFARYWPRRDYKDAEARWFSSTARDSETGGVFTGAINRADSINRDAHMVRLITAAARAGERPFVVVGRNHVPMQAPALDCLLAPSRDRRRGG